jgi:hypothetical protein
VMWGRVHACADDGAAAVRVAAPPEVCDVEDAPLTPQSWASLHRAAVAAGDNFYQDPDTRLMVMTELVHRARGSCCGKACRHCPYAHERVALRARASDISRAAWLVPPPARARPPPLEAPTVLLCSCSVADVQYAEARAAGGAAVALVVPLAADSRTVEGSGAHAREAAAAAAAAGVPLIGLPVHPGGPEPLELLRDALHVADAGWPGSTGRPLVEVGASLGPRSAVWRKAVDSMRCLGLL